MFEDPCTVFDMKQKFTQRRRAECHRWILLRQMEVLFYPPLPTPPPHLTPNRHHSSLSLSSLWTNRFCHSPLLLLGCTTTMTCHNAARPVRLYTNRDTLTSAHTLSLPENKTSQTLWTYMKSLKHNFRGEKFISYLVRQTRRHRINGTALDRMPVYTLLATGHVFEAMCCMMIWA